MLPLILLLSLDMFCHLLLITCYNGSLPCISDEVSFPFCMAFCWANAGSALLLALFSGCSCQPDLKVPVRSVQNSMWHYILCTQMFTDQYTVMLLLVMDISISWD